MTTDLEHMRDKFYANVERSADETACWIWTGSTNYRYGHLWDGRAKKLRKAHRVSYEIHIGPIPNGLVIDHLCRNILCVNPAHLEAVTIRENTLRGVGPTSINARKTHCNHGHEFTEQNTYRTAKGRYCVACQRNSHRRRALLTRGGQ